MINWFTPIVGCPLLEIVIDTFELSLDVTHSEIAVVDFISGHCELSRGDIKKTMQCGAVWLTRANNTRRLRRAKSVLQAGDTLHIYYNPDLINSQPPAALLIADEGDYSVWYKPAGMFTLGTKWGDHHSIGRWAEMHLQPQRVAKIVHRLDRHTSGLILLAHSKEAARGLSALFANRQIEKHYHAIVEGEFGTIGSTQTVNTPIDDKPATSHATVLEISNDRSLVDVKIDTGRKHQVRRHLSDSGFPIVGDRLFGTAAVCGLQLFAVSLAFQCPVTAAARKYRLPASLRPKLSEISTIGS